MSARSVNCNLNHNQFCFVCARYLFSLNVRSVDTVAFLKGYKDRFRIDASARNKLWSPDFCCGSCYNTMIDSKRKNNFESPVIWNEPQNHPNDCFFCKSKVSDGGNIRKAGSVTYPTGTSVILAVQKASPTDGARSVSPAAVDFSNIPRFVDDRSRSPTERARSISPAVVDFSNIPRFVDDPMDFGEPSTASTIFNEPMPSTSLQAHAQEQAEAGANPAVPHVEPTDDVLSGVSMLTTSSHSVWTPPKYHRDLQPPKPTVKSPKLTQAVLNDMVRGLSLPKDAAELLASRQKQLLKEFQPTISNG